jgi:Na+/proline symporter/signal transduction histidine kinase
MFNPLTVITAICLYVGFLFFIALWVERKSSIGKNIGNNPVVYSLSLAVFCSAWTYYGSVGKAATSGMLFLTIYLGPTIAIILWWTLIRKTVRIKNTYRITSIADFISARYGKSRSIAAIATIVAVTGITPYIALQLKAVISTFGIITSADSVSNTPFGLDIGPVVVILMIVFTIIFGVRRLDPTERHQGMIVALAVECIVKLIAFLAAGIFVTYFLFDGFNDIFQHLPDSYFANHIETGEQNVSFYIMWTTYLILAMSAFMFLPRQFHVSVVENFDEKHIKTAMWLSPLYMLLINLFVFPIAMGGLLKGFPINEADIFVLALPLHSGQKVLSLLVFLGGFSAATGMMMISSMTMATMITNHLLLPLTDWVKRLDFLKRYLLQCRWVAVATYILVGYWFELRVGESFMLVNMGMISFAAVLQFAPSIVGGIFWKQGNKIGVLSGLSAGFAMWIYTLILPAFIKSGWLPDTLLENGPWGIGFLKPENLFGMSGFDSLSHGVFWSIILNISFYVLGSLYFRQGTEELSLSEDFVNALEVITPAIPSVSGETFILLADKRKAIEKLLGQFFPETKAYEITEECLYALKLDGKERISILELTEMYNKIEKILAGSIGVSAAHYAIKHGISYSLKEEEQLSKVYAAILTDLRLTPSELKEKIDYYQERDNLLTWQAKELEETIKERTSKLESAQNELIKREKLSVLGRLTAVVSHELRNPLGVIRSSAFYLNRRLSDGDEKMKKHINRIEEQVKICDSIVGDLLEFTRERLSEKEQVEINSWIQNILDQISVPDHVKVINEPSFGLPAVYFDKEKMRRVIVNLVNNALHAVILRRDKMKEERYQPQITVSTSNAGDGVHLEVEDNGIGMDDETMSHAFEPLFTTKAQGTGLGLAIVQKITKEHGGSVLLKSALNQGTKVIVIIPIDRELSAASQGMEQSEERSGF